MKNNCNFQNLEMGRPLWAFAKKIPLVMKLFIICLFCSIGMVQAVESYAQNVRISLKVEEETVADVLKEIEEASEFDFFYNNTQIDLNRRVSVSAQNSDIFTILEDMFAGTKVRYTVLDKKIILSTELADKQQQQKPDNVVKGKVVDVMGEPVIGASVKEVGTNNGIVTDIDGNFSLAVQPGASLEISFVGYKTETVEAVAGKSLAVTLKEDNELLDEVVVIGYGTARKSDLTGSISTLRGDRLNEQSNPNLSAQLQGQIAGVQVMRTSGDPSSSSEIRIHGITTMSDNSPLVIIDGIPGTLDDVAPSEVEDIQVLKDAASASIYGSRAAAGVILISTKRAKNNRFNMSYNYEYGIDIPTEMPEYASARDWMILKNELNYNDGGDDLYGVYSQDFIDTYEANHVIDPDHYPMTDWQDVLLNERSNHQRHSFTLSGGTEKLLTNFSLNYYKGNSIIPGKEYERIYARINNDFKINNWIHAKVDLNIRLTDNEYPNSPIYYTHHSHPLTADFWSNGLIAQGRDGENPYALLTLAGKKKTRGFGFSGKIGIDLVPFKGLTISAVAAPTYYLYKSKDWDTKFELYDMEGNIYPNSSTTNLREDRNDNNSLTFQLYANYDKKIGLHSFNLMAGYEDYAFKWENQGAWRNNYVLSSYPYLNLGPEDQQYNNGNAGHNAYRSYFARVMYSYAKRYLLQVNVRSDGSSRFAKGHRWGTFPSASVGWVLSEESWLKDNKVLDFLKLRASVGQLGNERIGSEFPYQASMEFGNAYIPNKTTGIAEPTQIAFQSTYAFRDITWETTTTYGIGLDANFFNNRLRFTGDWYYKKTKDMLLIMNFPNYTGYNAPEQNAGEMSTKGWEVALAWNDNINEFNYGASFNLSDYRSKMGYLGNLRQFSGSYITEEGSYYQEWYLYKNRGIFLNDDALYDDSGNKVPVRGNEVAGCIQFEDIDGDGKITADKDRVYCGNSLPELQFGASFWANYKGFDFNLSLQGVGHWLKYINDVMVRPLEWGWGQVPKVLVNNHWSPYNTDDANAKMKYPLVSWAHQGQLYEHNDFWLYNAAYMRVKNITIGYTIPQSITKRFNVNGLRLYVSVNDLPAFDLGNGGIDGWDPEQNVDEDFITTSLIFGAKITF